MAGALGFKLGGPRLYGGESVDDVFMGDGRAELDAADIFRALALYRRACVSRSARWRFCAVAWPDSQFVGLEAAPLVFCSS